MFKNFLNNKNHAEKQFQHFIFRNRILELLLCIYFGLVISACNSSSPISLTPINTLESSVELIATATEAPSSLPVYETPVSLPTSTPLPEISATSTPTEIPNPPYTHMGMEFTGSNFVEQVSHLADARVGWIRWNGISWASIEAQEGVRNWTKTSDFETYAQAVSAAGMNLIAIVRRTPSWAQAVPGYACGPILPEKLDTFGQFMNELVARYSKPPFNVKYWELGNEPDIDPSFVPPDFLFGCWGDQTDPYYGGGYYAEMLKKVYPQIKAADPDAHVLIGGLLLDCDPNTPPLLSTGEPKDCASSRFLEGILLEGGGAFFDGISFHAYDYYRLNEVGFINASWGIGQSSGIPVTYYKTSFLRSLLNQYGYSDTPLYNTETALLCGSDKKEPICQTEEFNKTKANYVLQSYVVAKGEGLHANVWYHYQRGWRASGLVSERFDPYPAFEAYRLVSQMLEGTLSLGQVLEYPKVVGYKFFKPDASEWSEVWVVWSSDGNSSTITLPDIPLQVFDASGISLPPLQTLEINVSPIYIEFK